MNNSFGALFCSNIFFGNVVVQKRLGNVMESDHLCSRSLHITPSISIRGNNMCRRIKTELIFLPEPHAREFEALRLDLQQQVVRRHLHHPLPQQERSV